MLQTQVYPRNQSIDTYPSCAQLNLKGIMSESSSYEDEEHIYSASEQGRGERGARAGL